MLDYRELPKEDKKIVNKEIHSNFSGLVFKTPDMSELQTMLIRIHLGKNCANCFCLAEECECAEIEGNLKIEEE